MLEYFFTEFFFLSISIKLEMTPEKAKNFLEKLHSDVIKDINHLDNLSPFIFKTYVQYKEFLKLKKNL